MYKTFIWNLHISASLNIFEISVILTRFGNLVQWSECGGVNWIHLALRQGPIAGYCEQGSKSLNSIRGK